MFILKNVQGNFMNIFYVYSVRVFCKQANHVKRTDTYPNKPLSALVLSEVYQANTILLFQIKTYHFYFTV